MKHILANLIPYKKQVLILLLLLIIQAYADLSLPQYTSDIIDVGIQNKGIEHILPIKVEGKDYQFAMSFMTEEEAALWQAAYDSGNSEGIYTRTAEEETLDQLDETLLIPLVMAYQAEQQSKGNLTWDNKASGTEAARQQMEVAIEAGSGQMFTAMATAYAADCDERAGVNVNQIQARYLWKEALLMILMTLVMISAAITVSFMASRIGASIGRNLRAKVFENVIGYSNTEMDQFSTASLITRCTNDVQQVQMVTTMMLRMVLFAPVMATWGIIKVIQTGAHMGWVIVFGVGLIICVVMLLMAVTMPKFRIMQTLIDRLNLVAREILTGLSVIRAFRREETEERRFDGANTDLMRTQLFTNRAMAFMMPGMLIIMNALVVLITWTAAGRIDRGQLQVGAMTAFITYSMMIIMSFMIITVMSILIPRAGVAAGRIHEVVSTETQIRDPEAPKEPETQTGTVRFDHVDFRYPGAQQDVLSDISFVAEPGKTTAIIGSTGAGKTTLVNLILRLFDVTGGSLTVDGVEVRDRSIRGLRQEIGYVPQKGILFSGTIGSNIRFGAPKASDQDVAEAAEIAQAEEFIIEKEDGMDSLIAQGGSNVSGGQKQRLAIARALARKPKILIFDDSFSALDMKTDARLRARLAEKVKDTTVIIVAQRISTILRAEQILVLDEGRIVGKGTHSQLMEGCEVYRQIAQSQLSGQELEGVM